MSAEYYPTRFGKLPVPSTQIWRCDPALAGFSELQRFVLLHVENQGPFLWLQALEDPAIAFPLCDPIHFGVDYAAPKPACGEGTIMLMVIVPRDGDAAGLRAHQMAPLYFCPQQRVFRQWIVEAPQPCQGSGAALPPATLLAMSIRLGLDASGEASTA
ncbi:flagellar assembly protein FliW [Candidatus Igneacidithiobacillus taiwanensis]|uniref:flagellar assembly protein FliW n=1 Tax=Candidatus Igneacidithiobacillus taiwanensis TaxID=1945924 RepID=UPI00289DCA5C|nr:flagellar assembly protein FliW [Candidatus Igneacidithiobacillus taiwanensis]MCE5359556.1 flagellar assembly protein FliW [Acidithiobacillus sp.]